MAKSPWVLVADLPESTSEGVATWTWTSFSSPGASWLTRLLAAQRRNYESRRVDGSNRYP